MFDGLLDQVDKVVHRILEQRMRELFRDAVSESQPPRVTVGAEQEAGAFTPQIETNVGIAYQWKQLLVPFQRFECVRYQVLVLEYSHGQALPRHFSNLAAVESTSVNNNFAANRTLVGGDHPFVIGVAGDAGYAGEAGNFGARVPRAAGKRVG